jgi:hypothetical protein
VDHVTDPRSTTRAAPLTALDEAFRHQLVAPASATAHPEAGWAERTYHLLHVGGPLMLHAGRAVHPHGGRRTGFAGVTDGRAQHALRLREPFAAGDDPDLPRIGPLRIEPVRPMREVRLLLDPDGGAFGFDLTFRARFAPVATAPNRIERDGRVVTEYMNVFQSGRYAGTVLVDGAEHRVEDRPGFRDRGWGLRKHEGAPRRGLVVAVFCELPGAALYAMLYETASGRRAFTNGWLLDERGVADAVASAEHDLAWDGTLLTGGSVRFGFASGAVRVLEVGVVGRLFLSAAGYVADERRDGPGREVHDVTRPDVVARLDGQNDNACAFRLDGEEGHGYVETGLGVHARYRPE